MRDMRDKESLLKELKSYYDEVEYESEPSQNRYQLKLLRHVITFLESLP